MKFYHAASIMGENIADGTFFAVFFNWNFQKSVYLQMILK